MHTNLALRRPIDPSHRILPYKYNPTHDQLWAPIHGPAHPYAKDGLSQGQRNHKHSFVEDAFVHPFLFNEQYNTFHKYGYAFVGDLDLLTRNSALSVYNIPQ